MSSSHSSERSERSIIRVEGCVPEDVTWIKKQKVISGKRTIIPTRFYEDLVFLPGFLFMARTKFSIRCISRLFAAGE